MANYNRNPKYIFGQENPNYVPTQPASQEKKTDGSFSAVSSDFSDSPSEKNNAAIEYMEDRLTDCLWDCSDDGQYAFTTEDGQQFDSIDDASDYVHSCVTDEGISAQEAISRMSMTIDASVGDEYADMANVATMKSVAGAMDKYSTDDYSPQYRIPLSAIMDSDDPFSTDINDLLISTRDDITMNSSDYESIVEKEAENYAYDEPMVDDYIDSMVSRHGTFP